MTRDEIQKSYDEALGSYMTLSSSRSRALAQGNTWLAAQLERQMDNLSQDMAQLKRDLREAGGDLAPQSLRRY